MQILIQLMINFSAVTAIKGMALLDATGLVMRWKMFYHAAHLPGVMCGIVWACWGSMGQEGGARYGLIQHEGQEQEGVMRGCDIQGSLVIIGLYDSFESYFPEIKFALDFTVSGCPTGSLFRDLALYRDLFR